MQRRGGLFLIQIPHSLSLSLTCTISRSPLVYIKKHAELCSCSKAASQLHMKAEKNMFKTTMTWIQSVFLLPCFSLFNALCGWFINKYRTNLSDLLCVSFWRIYLLCCSTRCNWLASCQQRRKEMNDCDWNAPILSHIFVYVRFHTYHSQLYAYAAKCLLTPSCRDL